MPFGSSDHVRARGHAQLSSFSGLAGSESDTLLAHLSHFCHNGRPMMMPYNSQFSFVKNSLGPSRDQTEFGAQCIPYSN